MQRCVPERVTLEVIPLFIMGLWSSTLQGFRKPPVWGRAGDDTRLRPKYFIKTGENFYCLLKCNVGGSGFLSRREQWNCFKGLRKVNEMRHLCIKNSSNVCYFNYFIMLKSCRSTSFSGKMGHSPFLPIVQRACSL